MLEERRNERVKRAKKQEVICELQKKYGTPADAIDTADFILSKASDNGYLSKPDRKMLRQIKVVFENEMSKRYSPTWLPFTIGDEQILASITDVLDYPQKETTPTKK